MDVQWNNLMFTVKGLGLMLAAWAVGEAIRWLPRYFKARKQHKKDSLYERGYQFAACHLISGGSIELLRSMTKHGEHTVWDDGVLKAIEAYEENHNGSQH